MLKSIQKFFKTINIFKNKVVYEVVYEKYVMGGDKNLDWQKVLIAENRKLLSENQVPINKIRFVFQPVFQYDIDKNEINPEYVIMLPVNENQLFNKKAPVIEIKKPKNLINVSVQSYRMSDNYEFLKQLVKKSKRGVVIYVSNQSPLYKYSVNDEVIRIAILDDEIKKYSI